jgi:hypothetical protein
VKIDPLPDSGFPVAAREGQKRLDFFFAGMLIRIALNEYSFRITGDGAALDKKVNKIDGKAAALPFHGE